VDQQTSCIHHCHACQQERSVADASEALRAPRVCGTRLVPLEVAPRDLGLKAC
jgi:hypothetical protein